MPPILRWGSSFIVPILDLLASYVPSTYLQLPCVGVLRVRRRNFSEDLTCHWGRTGFDLPRTMGKQTDLVGSRHPPSSRIILFFSRLGSCPSCQVSQARVVFVVVGTWVHLWFN